MRGAAQAHSRPTIWTKSKQRSGAKKYLFGNFTARHLLPNEHYLNRAGLRGRKLWLCLCLFLVVYIIALAHLTLTCVVLGVLRFGVGGPPYFVFQSDGSLVWPEGANLTDVRLASPSSISAYNGLPLGISGEDQNTIVLQSSMAAASADSSRMAINQSSVRLSPTGSLYMLNSVTRQPILSLNSSYLGLPDLPALSANLTATRLTTNSVRNLNGLQSSRQLFMRGAAGVNIMGQFVNVTAGGDATLTAGTEIEIEGGSGGVSVNIPRIAGSVSPSGAEQGYHLCSCGNGRIFLVNSNPLGCFAAVGHNQLGNVCS